MDIHPNADSIVPNGITSFARNDDGINHYYLYNQGSFVSNGDAYNPYEEKAPAAQEIRLLGEGQPYLMNLWSGRIEPVAYYTVENGYVHLWVELDIHEAAIIAVEENNAAAALHATNKSGELVYDDSGNILLKAQQTGNYPITLNDGMRKVVNVPSVAAVTTPQSWQLTVESWTPANDFDTTYGEKAVETFVREIGPISLTQLVPWREITGLGDDISGVGEYNATFQINGTADGALLYLGEVYDTVSVWVNGEEVEGINQSTKGIDLGNRIHSGNNTLRIRSASTLRNTIRTYDSAYASKSVHEYGLSGPVTIQPYVFVPLEQEVIQPSTYTITAHGGTSDRATATAGETVTIAATVPSSQHFVRWDRDGISFANANETTTTFIMPAHNVMITAAFEAMTSTGRSSRSSGNSSGGSSIRDVYNIVSEIQRLQLYDWNEFSKDLTAAIEKARQDNPEIAECSMRIKNYGTVPISSLDIIRNTAEEAGIQAKVYLDQISGNAVVSRVYIQSDQIPTNLPDVGELDLTLYQNTDNTVAVARKFQKHFPVVKAFSV